MKRVIMPVLLLAAMMQLNGAARGRTAWTAGRGLLRPSRQPLFSAGKGVYPAGSRLLSTGSPATATKLGSRFSALATTPTQTGSQGSGYWSWFKGLFAPGAAVATAAYLTAQKGEEEPANAWLYRFPASSADEEMARAYYTERNVTLAVPEMPSKALMQATEARNDARDRYLNAEEMKNAWKGYGDVNYTSKGKRDTSYETHYAEVERVADAAKRVYQQAEERYAAAKAYYDAARFQVEQSSRLQE